MSLSEMISSLWSSTPVTLNIGDPDILKLGSMLHTMLNHMDTKIDVPTIISVGSQSSGKSSVINGILSMDILPTGKNMVTRTPLKLELIHRESQAHLEFGSYGKSKSGIQWTCTGSVNLTTPVPTVTEISQVREMIKERTITLAGNAQNISRTEINIKLFSPSVPDLTIIDLPGLVQVACTDRGQPADIKKQIIDMVEYYAKKENTIIMAVMAARTDLEADISLALIKRCDPGGKRTLGVLTKVDLMEKESHVGDYIRNNISVDLKVGYGYFAVRNRGSSETKQLSIMDGFAQETKYFESHEIYGKMTAFANQFGIRHLSSALSSILVGKLKQVIPSVVDELRMLHEKARIEMRALGAPLPGKSADRIPILHNLLMTFSKDFISGVSSRGAGVNTGRKIKEIFIKYRIELGEIQPFDEQSYPDKLLGELLQNFEGNHMSSLIPPIEVLEYCINDKERNPYKSLLPPSNECVNDVRGVIVSLIRCILNRPGLQRFPELVEFIETISLELIESHEEITRRKIMDIVRMEECYVWTDDEKFRTSLSQMSLVHDNQGQIANVRKLLQQYFLCTSDSIRHSIPKAVMFYFVKRIQEDLTQRLFDKLRASDDAVQSLLNERSDEAQRRLDCKMRFENLDHILKSNLVTSKTFR